MTTNEQMIAVYGNRDGERCRECQHFVDGKCEIAKTKVVSIWNACGKFEER